MKKKLMPGKLTPMELSKTGVVKIKEINLIYYRILEKFLDKYEKLRDRDKDIVVDMLKAVAFPIHYLGG